MANRIVSDPNRVSKEFIETAQAMAEAARRRQVLGYPDGPIPCRPDRRRKPRRNATPSSA